MVVPASNLQFMMTAYCIFIAFALLPILAILLQGIYVPEMVHELTTGRVLTIEWLDGVRLRSAGQSPGDGQTLRADEMKLIEVKYSLRLLQRVTHFRDLQGQS